MALALYRRYRPDTFAGVIGQDQVTVPLMRALDEGKLTHAYLFSGPRGCGKTVMLTRLGDVARNHGWRVIDETASPDLCERLIARIAPRPGRLSEATIDPSVLGVGLGSVHIAPALRPTRRAHDSYLHRTAL